MSELDTRQALCAVARILKTQMVYVQGVHKNLVALYEVLKAADPDLESKHRLAMDRPQVWREYENSIRNIDALIQQLEKE